MKKRLKCMSIIILTIIGVFLIVEIFLTINLSYNENERYFDEINGIVYHAQSIIGFVCLLVLCVSIILFMILFVKK